MILIETALKGLKKNGNQFLNIQDLLWQQQKKNEIIRVAQENLYMLKRLNEKTSAYNVDKWKKDYEASQYYKRSHCQYPSIDFYKTQKCNSFGNMFTGISKNSTKNDFYTKTQYSKGIRVGQWDLNPNALKSVPFILPPAEEQRAIVSYIEERFQKIDSLTTELQAEIDHLKEYKQRLIADVVTGQVNVQ